MFFRQEQSRWQMQSNPSATAVTAASLYSMPGILNHLQTEWKRFEKERNEWEIERSDLRARLVFLEGERKAMETLKSDLVKRVKMLEFALRQERNKGASQTSDQVAPGQEISHAGGLMIPHAGQGGSLRKLSSVDSGDAAFVGSSHTINFTKSFGQSRSREILKSYLKEADNLLAATKISSAAAHTRPRLPFVYHENDQHVPAASVVASAEAASHHEEHLSLGAEEAARRELAKKRSLNFDSKPPLGSNDSFGDYHLVDRGNLPGNFELNTNKSGTIKAEKKKARGLTIPKKMPGGPERAKSPGEVVGGVESKSHEVSERLDSLSFATSMTGWVAQPPLRSHYDSIRSVAFHPADTSIVTGSEDQTVKLWRLSTTPNPPKDSESRLVCTYKGHTGPVTSVAVSPIEDMCFSGSMDASIRVWALAPLNKPAFSIHDTSSKIHTLIGHSDAVWAVQPHMTSPLLLSCSADGSLKLWDVTFSNAHLKSTYWYHGPNIAVSASSSEFESPTSTCWGNGNVLVAAYRNSIVKVFDAETRAITMTMASNATFDNTSKTQINKIINHPTLSTTITAHQDGEIRLFDSRTGKCVQSYVAHESGVASISISPDGFTLVSGGHDGSVKFWDVSSKKCLQTIPGLHAPSVWSVSHHKLYKNMIASGGSGGCLRILYS